MSHSLQLMPVKAIIPASEHAYKDIMKLNDLGYALQLLRLFKECGQSAQKSEKRPMPRRLQLDIKPHICEQCGASFKRRDQLRRHTDTIHREDRPFKCNACPFQTKRHDNLKAHTKRLH